MELGAVDRSASITPLGRSMVRLPLHPRLSRLLLRAEELGCLQLGADLAAILSERDLFRANTVQGPRDPDLSERLELLSRSRQGGRRKEYADQGGIRSVERTSRQLLRLLSARDPQQKAACDDAFSRLLLAAFPDRIAKRRNEGGGRFVLVQGRGVRLSQNSHLVDSPYIVAVAVDAGERAEGMFISQTPFRRRSSGANGLAVSKASGK